MLPSLRPDPLHRPVPTVGRLDGRAMDWMGTVDHGTLRPVLGAVARGTDWLLPQAAVSLWLARTGDATGRHAALRGWGAMAVASAAQGLLIKPSVERRRPDPRRLGRRQRRNTTPSTSAFPSGHISVAAAFAAAVGARVPRLRLPLVAGTVVAAYAQVYTGRHYPSDVVAGTALGGAVGVLMDPARRRADGR